MSRTKKIIHLAILAAIASVFSVVDRYVSGLIFPLIPGAKIGIANIVILISLINFTFKDSLLITILKSLIGGLLFFGLTSFIIGGIASLASLLVMYLIKILLKDHVSTVGISLCGGVTHCLVQLLVIMIMYGIGEIIFVYGLYLLIISIVSSIVLGLLAIKTSELYMHIYNKKESE